VAAGKFVVLTRQGPGAPFEYSQQPIEGIAVGLAATRGPSGEVAAFVSVAPPAVDASNPSGGQQNDVGGFPPGDGELLRQVPGGGWQDLSLAQYPGAGADQLPGDGVLKADPVLALAASPDGTSAWAVGGYAGTISAAGLGTSAILPARSTDWYTSSIWRFDASQQAAPAGLGPSATTIPASPGTVSFAFFSGPECNVQCAGTLDAQPDVNLEAAAKQIATFAGQPGGPAFAVLGGNARGPINPASYQAGAGAFDFERLPLLLAPLGGLPLFAAYGPLDAVPTEIDPAEPWADAFASAPPPFGAGPSAAAITPAGAGAAAGVVHRYYAFDATQNGGRLRVIVLDNSAGSLEASAPGQTQWLQDMLADARAQGIPVVVVAGQPLRATPDGNATATILASAGVLAVFTGSPTQTNELHMVPDNGSTQIPEYEGGSLGYQQQANDGVVWYDVSVDTTSSQVHVNAVPVIDSLAIDPLDGLTVPRSFTLQFEAVARRPVSTLATTANNDSFPGFASYVNIPAPSCGSCIQPTYTFSSSDPTIGDFVVPSGSGSRFPQLDATGKTTHSSTSGLFCAYNTGTTTVSVTTGLLTYSVPVTVQEGGFGPPCGTVFRPGVNKVVVVTQQSSAPAAASVPPPAPAPAPTVASASPFLPPPAPPPPPPASPLPPVLPTASAPPTIVPTTAPVTAPPAAASPPSPPPPPAPVPPAAEVAPPAPIPPPAPVPPPLAVLPIPTPPPQPIPPGGAALPGTAPQPASAPRREKAKKHASQSAFSIRPSGAVPGWFYGATGGTGLLVLLLAAAVVAQAPRRRDVPAPAWNGRRPPSRR
jgi:hypothetical protein